MTVHAKCQLGVKKMGNKFIISLPFAKNTRQLFQPTWIYIKIVASDSENFPKEIQLKNCSYRTALLYLSIFEKYPELYYTRYMYFKHTIIAIKRKGLNKEIGVTSPILFLVSFFYGSSDTKNTLHIYNVRHSLKQYTY